MKAETKTGVCVEIQRIPTFNKVEIVLRCIKHVMEANSETMSNGKGKFGGQLDKQRIKKRVEGRKENHFDLVDLINLIKEKCLVSDGGLSDIISRSPMRTQDCHQSTPKPYEFPHNTSRVYGGVTRVVESERANTGLYERLCTSMQAASKASEGHGGDVDLCDISRWLNLCKRDPKFLNDFVEDCKSEFSKKEMPNLYECGSNRNVCSSVSSQFTSPAQSPSERSLTSPESVTFEENSLYYCRSPNIKALEEEKRISTSANDKTEPHFINFTNYISDLNILPEDVSSEPEANRTAEMVPNIGTVMLNLAQDPYESTIDLNRFASVCDGNPEPEPGAETDEADATSERDALNGKLDPKAKESAWARINQLNIDLLGRGDKDGDTQLMILLVSDKVTLEYIYAIVERLLKENPEYLSCRNELNQDALYLAAFKFVWEPLIASYLAEALVRGKQDLNMKYDGGNTLVHCLARQGDTHARVLERLVKLKHPNRMPVFDVNKKNNRGYTALHVACESHKKEVVHAYQTVRVLLENGADCTLKDYKDENTPLHTLINESCDVDLLRILLGNVSKFKSDGPLPTVVPNRQGNTALHLSCGRNTVDLIHQKEVIGLLLEHGAMIHLKNINGCVPSVLVDSSRKQDIKAILHGHRQKQS